VFRRERCGGNEWFAWRRVVVPLKQKDRFGGAEHPPDPRMKGIYKLYDFWGLFRQPKASTSFATSGASLGNPKKAEFA
jgi:hypothetical protein